MGRREPARRLDLTPSFLSDLLSTLTERGRALLRHFPATVKQSFLTRS